MAVHPDLPVLNRQRAIRLLPWATALVAALIIAATFWQGVRRGMDHAVAFGPESEQTAIAIALSETVYGLDLGYVGHAAVFDALRTVWNRGATSTHDPVLVKNSHDRDLMNEAIAAASALPSPRVGYFSDRSLISAVYDDLGYVDFTKIAFAVFGRQIEAMYYLYFTVLAVSALTFLIAYRDRALPQLVLLLSLFGYFIELHTALFHDSMPSFTGLRHSGTLAILPAWHLAFALIYRVRPTATNLIAGLIQLAILILMIRIRGSAVWVPLFLVALSCALAWRQNRGRGAASIAKSAAQWPIVLLIAAIGLQTVYSTAKLHPIYFTDDVIPHHGLWHSAYLGLADDPGILPEVVRQFIAQGGGGDAIGAAGAMEYVERTRFIAVPPGPLTVLPPSYISPWTGTVKFQLHDKIMQRAFFDATLSHPFRTLRLYIIRKPVGLFLVFDRYVFTTSFFGLMLVAAAASYLVIRLNWLRGEPMPDMFLAGGLAVALAILPSMWASPGISSVVDLVILLAVVLPLAVAGGCHRLSQRLPAFLARKA